jgi:uncharacterized protein (TIGR04255 family)
VNGKIEMLLPITSILTGSRGNIGMQYESNPLTDVIFRIDFDEPVIGSKKLADDFYNLIKSAFPKKDIVQGVVLRAQMVAKKDGNKLSQSQQKVTNYRFLDENQKKILMLEPSTDLNLVLKVYKNSRELKDVINLIIDSVIKVYGDIKIKRTGLRYINEIVIQEGNSFDWAPFINRSLISSLEFRTEADKLSRSMGMMELIRDDHRVLFQFGMYNPNYPNSISRKAFVLDFDCYTEVTLNASRIRETVEILQKDEEELFERSIEDGLREKMVVVDDDRS